MNSEFPFLCCQINPSVRCIGCNLPLCNEHFKEESGKRGKVIDTPYLCTVTYYAPWIFDNGHAFDSLALLRIDRDYEKQIKAKGKPPTLSPVSDS
jgi:hypothetical protein